MVNALKTDHQVCFVFIAVYICIRVYNVKHWESRKGFFFCICNELVLYRFGSETKSTEKMRK